MEPYADSAETQRNGGGPMRERAEHATTGEVDQNAEFCLDISTCIALSLDQIKLYKYA